MNLKDSPRRTRGIHHITAIAGDARRNLDFYAEVLGLRLVKRTVNFDDPSTYHFYFGDETGRPGTIMTFFPIPGARRGSRGASQATAVAFSVPEGSMEWWRSRLGANGVVLGDLTKRFGEDVLTFLDPDGLRLELVESADVTRSPGDDSLKAFSPSGLHSTTLTVQEAKASEAFLGDGLGLRLVGREGARSRWAAAGDGPGTWIDVLELPGEAHGQIAVGSVHHVAFRVDDSETQEAWLRELPDEGVHPTSVQERKYFRSIYFREPGGVLFEVATDGPGFDVDEAPEDLGSRLSLPEWLESDRERIEAALPALSQSEVAGR